MRAMSESSSHTTTPAETLKRLVSQGAQPQLLMARKLDQIVRRAPVTCGLETPIRDVLTTLEREDIGSMIILAPDGGAAGIFTLRDLLTRVSRAGRSDLDPIRTVMTPDPIALSPEVFALEAALVMARHGVHHVVIADGKHVIGLVSEKDLFALQQVGVTQISIALREASGIPSLVELSRSIRELTGDLLQQGVSAENLTRIVATLNDVLSQRVIELALDSAGFQMADFCWISLGSEGRREQTLATDQDNGIIFADPSDRDPNTVRELLLPVADRINRDLDACGFPLCRGKIMAGNPRWCLSAGEWRTEFRRWIFDGDPQAVLNATIFFDFRPLYGRASLAEELRGWLTAAAADNQRFLRQLADNALSNRPPLGVVRDFALSDDASHPRTINLKVNGATLFIDAARVFALATGIADTNTVQRLKGWAAKVDGRSAEVEAWAEAFNFVQLMRLRHQQAQIARNEPPNNHLDPDVLNTLDRRILREALRLAKALQGRLALDYRL